MEKFERILMAAVVLCEDDAEIINLYGDDCQRYFVATLVGALRGSGEGAMADRVIRVTKMYHLNGPRLTPMKGPTKITE